MRNSSYQLHFRHEDMDVHSYLTGQWWNQEPVALDLSYTTCSLTRGPEQDCYQLNPFKTRQSHESTTLYKYLSLFFISFILYLTQVSFRRNVLLLCFQVPCPPVSAYYLFSSVTQLLSFTTAYAPQAYGSSSFILSLSL